MSTVSGEVVWMRPVFYQHHNHREENMQSSKAETPIIGTAMEGGFFGGVINVNGMHKGVIWAPKQAGQIRAILLPSQEMIEGAGSPCDCVSNMAALIKAGSPAALRIAEMNIDGHQDWVIPSRDVLELGYRHFKPTDYANYCSWRDGENPNSVPPGWLYTADTPAKTSIEAFQDGGAEAFDDAWYWSSTVFPNGETAFVQTFLNGDQDRSDLSSECRVRAVRLIQLGT
jgi:hypothetical protein